MWYNAHHRKDIRQEYIDMAMSKDADVHQFKLTKRFISWLSRHYDVDEFSILFYDSETTGGYPINGELVPERPTTWDERMAFNNWIDMFADGCWCDSQKEVNDLGQADMNDFRKAGHLGGRCWIGTHEHNGQKCLHIYLYGHDIHELDFHFHMKRK